MALASFSVVAFFRKRPDLGENVIRVRVLPVIAGILLTSGMVLAVLNFEVLTGASEAIAWSITATLPLAAIVGVVLATRMRRSDPERYGRLGNSRF